MKFNTNENLYSSGIEFDTFDERQLSFIENGKQIYIRRNKIESNVYLFDIDNVAFVVGRLVSNFTGQYKKSVFSLERAWVEPDYRKQGLILTIVVGVFDQLEYALISDVNVTDDGEMLWRRIIHKIQPHNIYQYDPDTRSVDKVDISVDQMFNNKYQYIIEQTLHLLSETFRFKRIGCISWLESSKGVS